MTEDLELRMKQHNEGTLSFWTKRGTNWQLIYSEEFDNKSEALKKEKWLKTGAGREYSVVTGSDVNAETGFARTCACCRKGRKKRLALYCRHHDAPNP